MTAKLSYLLTALALAGYSMSALARPVSAPEPGTTSLLIGGVIAAAAVARLRRRK